MPTLTELYGIKLDSKNLDGKSLVPVIHNPETLTAHTEGYCWAFKDMWVARKGKWKMLGNPVDTSQPDAVLDKKLFLVNLEDDPGESTNLAGKYPEKVKELELQYKRWLSKIIQN